MTRRALSSSPAPSPTEARPPKRPRTERALTPDDYRDGVVLAPMVRSGCLPTRLFALKHGAKLVWGPELIDKAILHAKREVDPKSGTVSYVGVSKAMFTTHPIERPYLIYQIGTSDPALAVQAVKVIQDDVSGVDLNCGCPKPFSTHSGMGAALLSTPDLLVSILKVLRKELPERVSLSCKIRLLPNQEDTLKLVGRIIQTGINCLTVHCRTRNQRMREPATIERLAEIVRFVRASGKNIAVIANGDCQSWEDAKRVRAVTEADSVMIATAAESNPTVFSPTPLQDVERTLVPDYVRLCYFISNHYSSTKWSIAQFTSPHPNIPKTEHKRLRDVIRVAKTYEDCLPLLGEKGLDGGEEVLEEIRKLLDERERLARAGETDTEFTQEVTSEAEITLADVKPTDAEVIPASICPIPTSASTQETGSDTTSHPSSPILATTVDVPSTPTTVVSPKPIEPHVPRALGSIHIPAGVTGRDEPTPTPGGGVIVA